MEARPEDTNQGPDKPDLAVIAGGVHPPQTHLNDLPESRLADSLSNVPDGDLPEFVNPNNDTLPSDDGKNVLECLQALGTVGLAENRKIQILEVLTPVLTSKVGKKALKFLISLEHDQETRQIAASGFNILKVCLATSEAGGHLSQATEDSRKPKKNKRPPVNHTKDSLRIIKDPESKQSEKDRTLKKVLRPRMMLPPEGFFDDESIFEIFGEAVRAVNPNVAQAHYDLRRPHLDNYSRYNLASVEQLMKSWADSGQDEISAYGNPVISKLQKSFFTQMKFLIIPSTEEAAKFAKGEIKDAMLILNDAQELMKVTNDMGPVKELVDIAAGKALSFCAFPEGLKASAQRRINSRLAIVTMPAMVLGRETEPLSALERVTFSLTTIYDRIEEKERLSTN